jgi:MFS transporter, DHA1 family, multidrug resistance protein
VTGFPGTGKGLNTAENPTAEPLSPGPASKPRPHPVVLLALLGGLSAVGAFAFDMYLPAFPSIAAGLHVPPGQVQLTLIVALIGMGVGQIAAGPATDRHGRKLPVLAGTVLFTVSSLLTAFAPSITVLVVLRLLQGIGGGIGATVSRAVVRDLFRGAEASRYMSRVMLFFGVAPIIAPSIGAAVLHFTNWRGIFIVLSGYGALLALAILRWLPETLPVERRRAGGARDVAAGFRLLFGDRHFLGYALAQNLSFAGLFAYLSSGSFVLQEVFGVSAQTYALVFGANSVGLVLAGQISARLVRTWGPRTLLFGALLVGVFACVAVLIGAETGMLAVVVVGLFAFIASLGFVFPNSMALALDKHPDRAGSASALIGGLQSAISTIAGPLVAILGTATGVPMAAVMVGASLLSLVATALLTRDRLLPAAALSAPAE